MVSRPSKRSNRPFLSPDQTRHPAARRLVAVNRADLRLYSYKAFDQYAPFAVRGHGIDEVDAAQMVAVGAWARPVAALGLGLLGDRFGIRAWRYCVLYY